MLFKDGWEKFLKKYFSKPGIIIAPPVERFYTRQCESVTRIFVETG
jgi:hypothetical protein